MIQVTLPPGVFLFFIYKIEEYNDLVLDTKLHHVEDEKCSGPSITMHACNDCTYKTEPRELQVQDQTRL